MSVFRPPAAQAIDEAERGSARHAGLAAARRRMLTRGAPTAVEVAGFGLVSLVFGAIVFGEYVANGGFSLDDWAYASESERYSGLGRLFHMTSNLLSTTRGLNLHDANAPLMSAGGRPGAALYLSAMYTVFGSHPALHLAWTLFLAVVMSTLFFWLLRILRLERFHAGAIALLLVVFPASTATRLWPAASVGPAAICLFLGGAILALYAFRTDGRRALAFHAGSVALYAASLTVYEVALAAIALSGLLYAFVASWRKLAPRWGVDIVVAALGALYVRHHGTRIQASVHTQIDRARTIESEARTLLARLGVQDGRVFLSLKLVAALVLVAIVLAVLLREDDPVRPLLRRALVLLGAGIVTIGVGYAVFVGATDSFYAPLSRGIGNRTNTAAGLGFVIAVYALALLLALVVARAVAAVAPARSQAVAAVVVCVAILAVGVVWVHAVTNDRRAWERAASLRAHTLDVLAGLPKPAAGSSVYTFGVRGEAAPGVLIFDASWDLTGAIRMLWHDRTLRGLPGSSVDSLSCTRSGLQPNGLFYSDVDRTTYAKTLFVDVSTGRSFVVGTRARCEATARALLRKTPPT